ncbi:MAG: hypothetical protein NVV62_16485 [Terricaulis sp.]|nr:hypothetical protein [Terricaulis sp.]
MRIAAIIVAALACASGASLAQQADPPEAAPFRPSYERVADGPPVGRIVPPRMLDRGQSGMAHLCCTPRADRTLSCEVAHEWPRRSGFGAVAIGMAEQRRLTVASYEAYQNLPAPVALSYPVEFRMLPMRANVEAGLSDAVAGARMLCGEGSVPAEPIVVSAERIGRR